MYLKYNYIISNYFLHNLTKLQFGNDTKKYAVMIFLHLSFLKLFTDTWGEKNLLIEFTLLYSHTFKIHIKPVFMMDFHSLR